MTDHRIVSPRFLGRESEAASLLAKERDERIEALPGPGELIDSVAPIHRELASAVERTMKAGERPIAIVGDCCQTIAVMAGLGRAGVASALVWLDSHGDFNTWETTPSKFLGGMPLAMLTGRGDKRMMEAVGLAAIADARVVLSDARDLDPLERELVRSSSIAHVPDVAKVVMRLPDGPLYLHLDTDVLDAREAPAFLYPVEGGPGAEELQRVVAAIMATERVVAVSVCASWDAAKDHDGRTLTAVRRAVQPLM